ncbi:MAG: hypothetical protein WB562_16605 [Candidatus Sulfotelmatobacter sp.]
MSRKRGDHTFASFSRFGGVKWNIGVNGVRILNTLHLAMLAILAGGVSPNAVDPQVASPSESSPSNTAEPKLTYVHGTIVVVVSTKDGFVLAGDSRGSGEGCQPLPGEFQKVFPLGGRGAVVVAGLIGASDSTNELGEAIGTQLRFWDVQAHGAYLEATSIARTLLDSVGREAGLLDIGLSTDQLVSFASAVSISDKGAPEWITLKAHPFVRTPGTEYESWDVKVEQFIDPPDSRVLSLGVPRAKEIVDRLIERSGPAPDDRPSQTAAMRRYYSLKSANKLSDLNLEEGKAIAKLAINLAIDFADAHPEMCMGIGRPIDMLTVTAKGVEWIEAPDPSHLARAPLQYHVRVSDSDMSGRLDGAEWFRGTVRANATLTFAGKGRVRMVQPKFAGPCTFVLEQGAEERMPDISTMLKSKLGRSCDVYRETSSGRVKLSAAAAPAPAPPKSTNEYASLSDAELNAEAVQVATELRAFVTSSDAARRSIEEPTVRLTPPNMEEQSGAHFKYAIKLQENSDQVLSGYRLNFEFKLDAIERELEKRIKDPDKAKYYGPRGIVTTMEMYTVANDIDRLVVALQKVSVRPTL